MTARKIQFSITIAAIIFVAVHLIWPNLAIDAVTLTLIIVAILPWLAPLFKSVELPGVVKVEFQDLQQAREKADRAGLLSAPADAASLPRYSFQLVADEDPNLALAGLRIEVERRLVQIAESHGQPTVRQSAGALLRRLAELQLITGQEQSVLADMLGLLNSAVHGAAVDGRAAEWAMEVGPRLLRSLEDKVKK
jgi:hypothetical protein